MTALALEDVRGYMDIVCPEESVLRNEKLLRWLFGDFGGTKDTEDDMIRQAMGKKFTGALGEDAVLDVLRHVLNMSPDDIEVQSAYKLTLLGGSEKTFKIDLETKKYILEVKCGTYLTDGTAHQKLFGTDREKAEVIDALDKDLLVVCVGGAERYARLMNISVRCAGAHRTKWVMFTDLLTESIHALMNAPGDDVLSLEDVVRKC